VDDSPDTAQDILHLALNAAQIVVPIPADGVLDE